jgi:hypothetical protein
MEASCSDFIASTLDIRQREEVNGGVGILDKSRGIPAAIFIVGAPPKLVGPLSKDDRANLSKSWSKQEMVALMARSRTRSRTPA